MAQYSFDKLKSCRDATNRTGFSLTLGCLHRHVGSLGSGQHLNTSVSILLALAQDGSSAVVQVLLFFFWYCQYEIFSLSSEILHIFCGRYVRPLLLLSVILIECAFDN